MIRESSPRSSVLIDPSLTPELPKGALIEKLTLVTQCSADDDVVLELPPPLQRWAVRSSTSAPPLPKCIAEVLILSLPLEDRQNAQSLEPTSMAAIQRWVGHTSGGPIDTSCHLMQFQGAQIWWSPERCAIVAAPDRLISIRNALIEVTFYELELRHIERQVGAAWPEMEADLPLAFQFDERSIQRRSELKKRFQLALLGRARLARIGPYVHAPHLYPPTLSSQLSERLRERTRMMHRHEFLSEQLEVFGNVYELCGQRSSDYVHTRTGTILEWIIIILLLAQTLFTVVEIFAASGT